MDKNLEDGRKMRFIYQELPKDAAFITGQIAVILLAGYGFHATKTAHPMLNLILFRIRTFRTAVGGSFLTRLGIGGIPFLFPLLYQVGLGFTPIQSGLLMVPQAIAAMRLKAHMSSQH